MEKRIRKYPNTFNTYKALQYLALSNNFDRNLVTFEDILPLMLVFSLKKEDQLKLKIEFKCYIERIKKIKFNNNMKDNELEMFWSKNVDLHLLHKIFLQARCISTSTRDVEASFNYQQMFSKMQSTINESTLVERMFMMYNKQATRKLFLKK